MVGAAKKRARQRGTGERQSSPGPSASTQSGINAPPGSSHSEDQELASSHEDSALIRTSSAGRESSEAPLDVAPYDGNRDDPRPGDQLEINRNLDMSVTIWAHTQDTPIAIQKRPAPCKLGKEISLGLNTFNINGLPKGPIYQYDIKFGNGDESKPVIKKLWESKALQNGIPSYNRWIFDGVKILYSVERVDRELRIEINLDEEEGRVPKEGKEDKNKFRVLIRPARTNATIRFDQLEAYLHGRADFDTGCLEAINFLDHLMRANPSKNLVPIKRNFFPPQVGRGFDLGGGAEAFKGTYASVRIGHSVTGKHVLTVNVDVANGTFWSIGSFTKLLATALNCRENDLATRLRDVRIKRELKRKFTHIRLTAAHRGKDKPDSYCFKEFHHETAATHKLKVEGGKITTVAQYFQDKYKIRLRNDLPLVQMTKPGTVLPLELLQVQPNSKVNQKLDDKQTSQMIKFAVTPPPERWNDIASGVRALNWGGDPYLKGYDLKINPSNVITKARVLANPGVRFANNKDINPGVSGRWRIDGTKFLQPNTKPLQSWGVCILPGRGSPDRATVERFIQTFTVTYGKHGGRIANPRPVIHIPSNNNPATAVEETFNMTNKQFGPPQILMFVLPGKDAMVYGRIKKSCECRFGVMSQCMQSVHVMKAQGQYISNVCMKFNAKLGGTTARAVGATSKGEKGIFTKETVMITAADVTHPPPASQGLGDEARFSVAAIVNSQDLLCTRYTARVESNGFRQEIIQPQNFEKLWKPQLRNWVTGVGQGRFPSTIIYFRDGVSEGQFAAVIRQEVRDMKEIVRGINPKADVKFVVILATKRHHVRFFPKPNDSQAGDRNGNALPGTLVDSAVTHPYENDFFLCSHVALKGTARPVHYHILLNEANIPNDTLQTMIYEHCYQFTRASTPVSLFPAVYYADICALRGRYHDKNFGSTEQSSSPSQTGTGSSDPPVDVPPLLELFDGTPTPISQGMWYI